MITELTPLRIRYTRTRHNCRWWTWATVEDPDTGAWIPFPEPYPGRSWPPVFVHQAARRVLARAARAHNMENRESSALPTPPRIIQTVHGHTRSVAHSVPVPAESES